VTEPHKPRSFKVAIKTSPNVEAYRYQYLRAEDETKAKEETERWLQPNESVAGVQELGVV
jgi:hypothetical protein